MIHASSKSPNIKIIDLSEKALKFDTRSPTWLITQEKANKILNRINEPFNFSIFGRHSFFNVIKQMVGLPPADSCATWAINALFHAGINIRIEGNGFNLFTITPKYATADVKLKNYDIKDLCKFAKEGNVDSIEEFLDANPNFNVNEITKDACVGPVESYLGYYNPLSLAVAYNQLAVVKLLIVTYHADPSKKAGRREDHTALDCANRKFWFVEKTPEQKKEMVDFLEKFAVGLSK